MNLFEYTDYKAFIQLRLERGAQKKFAQFLRCQPAFLSQVLRGKPHLSLEQGILATDYFQMNKPEAEYFMLALQLGRAGSLRLKSFFKLRMDQLRESHQRVDTKIGTFEILDELSKATFYSSWKYAMIHVLLTVPTQNQIELLKSKTRLSEKEILYVIDFLQSTGLIEKHSGKWRPTKRRIHISPEESLVGTHHRNFRALTMRELEDSKRDSLHFSSTMALSLKDTQKIKEILLEVIAKTESILKPSPEETSRVFCIDFFEPGEI
jgi:uncharacterized protein (TIGR02147 family)